MEINYQVELELSVARRWLLDGNIKRAWLHLGLAKYYHLQEDKAAEHRVQRTIAREVARMCISGMEHFPPRRWLNAKNAGIAANANRWADSPERK